MAAGAQAPAAPAGFVRIQVSLDWSGSGHYDARRQLPCGDCGGLTNLRDDVGLPRHKTCAESAIEAKALSYAMALLPVPSTPARSRRTAKAVA